MGCSRDNCEVRLEMVVNFEQEHAIESDLGSTTHGDQTHNLGH